MVTATLPPFAQPGMHIDVTAAAIGDAVQSPRRPAAADQLEGRRRPGLRGRAGLGGHRRIWRRAGRRKLDDRESSHRRPRSRRSDCRAAGAVHRSERSFKLQLRQPDFTTALRISTVINENLETPGKPLAQAGKLGAGRRHHSAGLRDARGRVHRRTWKRLKCKADRPARVIINERTGTIVMGKEVRVSPVAIMHGKLTVEIQTTETVSQPDPFSQGNNGSGSGSRRERQRRESAQPGAASRARRWKNWSTRWARSGPRLATSSRFCRACAPPARSKPTLR